MVDLDKDDLAAENTLITYVTRIINTQMGT